MYDYTLCMVSFNIMFMIKFFLSLCEPLRLVSYAYLYTTSPEIIKPCQNRNYNKKI